MAHHHNGRYGQSHGTRDFQQMQTLPAAAEVPLTAEDELVAEADEPPDEITSLGRHSSLKPAAVLPRDKFTKVLHPPRFDRKKSLLSEAFAPATEEDTRDLVDAFPARAGLDHEDLKASSASCVSASSTADLTSDGGITSPARTSTPSPPPPDASYVVPGDLFGKAVSRFEPVVVPTQGEARFLPSDMPSNVTANNTANEAGLGRKRRIRFACGGTDGTSDEASKATVDPPPKAQDTKTDEKPKRPCALRFVCPFKAAKDVNADRGAPQPQSKVIGSSLSTAVSLHTVAASEPPRDASSGSKPRSPTRVITRGTPISGTPPNSDAEVSRLEATRFHEFASSVEEEEEWMKADAMHTRRLTVDDTLSKEKNIRRLGEEAEEEARQEDEESDAQDEIEVDESEAAAEDDPDGDISDGGNETDDEEGFADSDDETDGGSEFQFWTPKMNTATTSTDPAELTRSKARRIMPQSSMDSLLDGVSSGNPTYLCIHKPPQPRRQRTHRGTPPLPDSTDFVCGTLDEDRPLEDAYASCLEQRKRSTHTVIPQDIDPSFPTSDLEDDDGEDDDVFQLGNDNTCLKQQPNDAGGGRDDDKDAGPKIKAPVPSPHHLRSPPPFRHARLAKSPPPRHLMARSPNFRRLALPAAHARSRTPTPRSSAANSPSNHGHIDIFRADPRPRLMRTKSLPRTPNPFYQQYIAAHHAVEKDGSARQSSPTGHRPRKHPHKRGAIDIVNGLECKRRRRREKAWFKYCQRAAKGKERRPPPGQGAERMRELGLEKAGKNKGNGLCQQPAKYVLSI